MVAMGVASAAVAVGYLAWRRRFRGLRLLAAAGGWLLFFVGLAAAFQVMPYGPQLLLVGAIAGAVIQLAMGGRKWVSEDEVNQSTI